MSTNQAGRSGLSKSTLALSTSPRSIPLRTWYQTASKSAVSSDARDGEAEETREAVAVSEAREQALAHQQHKQPRDEDGLADVELRLDHEVQQRQDADRVDESMQPVPALASEPPDHGIGRRGPERRQAEKRHEADGQVEAQHDLASDAHEVEFLVDDVEREMGRRIGQDRDAQHASHGDELVPLRDPPQRRHRERDHQDPDRPEARPVDGLGDGLRREPTQREFKRHPGTRQEQRDEHDELEHREAP